MKQCTDNDIIIGNTDAIIRERLDEYDKVLFEALDTSYLYLHFKHKSYPTADPIRPSAYSFSIHHKLSDNKDESSATLTVDLEAVRKKFLKQGINYKHMNYEECKQAVKDLHEVR